ncbi:MAG: leucyl aminopeptidase [Planctomycetaceae bacterium]|nr:leucyl aminopeptidase [Planctomycetaceae bacterium]
MTFQVDPISPVELDVNWLIVTIAEEDNFHPQLQKIDDALNGQLTRLKENGDLTGKSGSVVKILDAEGIAASRLLVIGLGDPAKLERTAFDKAAMTAIRSITEKEYRSAGVVLNSSATHDVNLLTQSEIWAKSIVVGGFGQGLHKAEKDRFSLKDVTFVIESASVEPEVKESVARGRMLGDAINLTRELVNRTPDEMYPESFAARARQVADEYENLKCEIWDQKRLEDEKMGSMLAVARGSDREPRLVIMEYLNGGPDAPTIALVGKGVTFDSGGYSIKPSQGMITMKCDMAGAATVLGALSAIAEMGLKVNVIGMMGMVENLVSGKAYKLGDVLTARNGKTIEVHNTDAEGRLVLADVLSYAADREVDYIIDLATLTGACVVALGMDVVGLFSNNDDWSNKVLAAAKSCGESIWPMPMFDEYNELLKSDLADVKNIGGRWGGAITAAKFLENFVNETAWVHLDIAGPAYAESSKPHQEGGASGVMVKTLVETVLQLK